MKISHVIASLDNPAAGPSYTVPRLVECLSELGHAVHLHALGERQLIESHKDDVSVYPQDRVFPHFLKRLGQSRSMKRALASDPAHIFHAHGLWMMPTVYAASVAHHTSTPLVLAPRGMLGAEALRFSPIPKAVFTALWQMRALKRVSCFHATSMIEYNDIRSYGLPQPVAIIPNGIDLPDTSELDQRPGSSGECNRVIVALGRIHPKKGLDTLISAFSLVTADFPDWKLKIAGPDDDQHAGTLLQQIHSLGVADRVSISPAVYGVEKFRLLRGSELFAMTSLHENFGVTVAESLSVETPVLATRGTPWGGLVEHHCGWWVERSEAAIASALRVAMSLTSSERRQMGSRGRLWMARDFSWRGIGNKMSDVYAWLRNAAPPPDSVMLT